MGLGVESLSPAIPQQGTDTKVEPFTFKLAQAAPQTPADNQVSPQLGHRCPQTSANDRGFPQLSLSSIEKLESLADAVAGIEARVCVRFDSLEAKIAALHSDVGRVYTPLPEAHSSPPPHPPPMMPTPGLLMSMPYWQGSADPPATSKLLPMTSPLQERTNPFFNAGVGGGSGGYQIPVRDFTIALNACRSHRNLAARLATKTFT